MLRNGRFNTPSTSRRFKLRPSAKRRACNTRAGFKTNINRDGHDGKYLTYAAYQYEAQSVVKHRAFALKKRAVCSDIYYGIVQAFFECNVPMSLISTFTPKMQYMEQRLAEFGTVPVTQYSAMNLTA